MTNGCIEETLFEEIIEGWLPEKRRLEEVEVVEEAIDGREKRRREAIGQSARLESASFGGSTQGR